ncbi:MAG: hypothetical protein HY290_01575 [Planctomycetia bacterium]|nr:hypothetical protein [Planctomycetia bacterium]
MPCRDELAAFGGFRDVAYPVRPHPLCRTYPVPLSFRYWNVDEHLESFQPDLILIEDLASLVGLTSVFVGGYCMFIGADFARRNGVPSITLIETDFLDYGATYFGSWTMRLVRPILAALIHRMSSSYDLHLMLTQEFVARHEAVRMVRGKVLHFHGVDTSEFTPANVRFDSIPGDQRPTPLVAAAAGGHLDQLVPDRNGLFSRPHDPADLAAQVLVLLTDPRAWRESQPNATIRCGTWTGTSAASDWRARCSA